jgi:hypothetical protein
MATTRNFSLAFGFMTITSTYTVAIRNLIRRYVINLRTYCVQCIVCTSKFSITNVKTTLNFEVMYDKFNF